MGVDTGGVDTVGVAPTEADAVALVAESVIALVAQDGVAPAAEGRRLFALTGGDCTLARALSAKSSLSSSISLFAGGFIGSTSFGLLVGGLEGSISFGGGALRLSLTPNGFGGGSSDISRCGSKYVQQRRGSCSASKKLLPVAQTRIQSRAGRDMFIWPIDLALSLFPYFYICNRQKKLFADLRQPPAPVEKMHYSCTQGP